MFQMQIYKSFRKQEHFKKNNGGGTNKQKPPPHTLQHDELTLTQMYNSVFGFANTYKIYLICTLLWQKTHP